MQVQVDANSNVVAYGSFPAGAPTGLTIQNVPDSEEPKLYEAGPKTIDASGVITVGTPAPMPVPVVVNANDGFINHLNAISLTAGGEADTLRNQVVQYLQGQPAVPAV